MKWGILATGTIAKKFASTVQRMRDSGEILVAVGSRREESARQFAEEYGILRHYGSYEELAADLDVEAVYVATPNNFHYENCIMCLNARKHILCEKPFTTNADDARELYRLAEEKGLFIMEAFWIRFLPVYSHLQKILKEDVIGQIRHIRCEYGFIAKGARKDRKFDSSLGGGALLDIGIYNLGFLHMITKAAPESFQSQVHINGYGTDDFSTIQLSYPGGCTAYCAQSIGMVMDRQAVIFGEKGTISFQDYQHAESFCVRLYDGQEYMVKVPFTINGFEYQIKETSRCVAEGRSASDKFTPEDSLTVLQLMDDIRKSWGMKFEYEKS